MNSQLIEIAEAIAQAGGRALVVGGYVRDRVLERPSKDVDVEVLGLDEPQLAALLARYGRVIPMGRSFSLLRVAGLDVDFSTTEDPASVGFDYARAAGRRDLTMNSMALDPLTDELLDPLDGRRDMAAGVLRAANAERFGDDPLRALRVAQFAARFDMRPDAELIGLCAAQDLSGVPGERLLDEFKKLLLRSDRPSIGFEVMHACAGLRFFEQLEALRDVPQDPEWHPEGDVWVHTLMALDAGAAMRSGEEHDDVVLMFAVLCHDFGKPATTAVEDGRIRSKAHDRLGVDPTRTFLARLRASKKITEQVCALVEHHLAPALFIKNEAKEKGYRRLARKLERAGTTLEMLVRVARADHLGRTTEEALAGRFPAGDRFLARARRLCVEERAPVDVVQGRHLIARGLKPGPHFSALLAQCRAVQDELGERDPDRILDRVL